MGIDILPRDLPFATTGFAAAGQSPWYRAITDQRGRPGPQGK